MSKKYPLEGRYPLTSHIVVILPILILFVSVAYFFSDQGRRTDLMAEFVTSRVLWESA